MKPPVYDQSTIKLGILYLLQEMDIGLERQRIEQVLLDDAFHHIEYFDLTEALADLKHTGLIAQQPFRGRSVVVLTPDGCQALEQFAARIPASMRKAIDAYLAANRAVLLENACIGADYRYLDKHQYLVELWAYEGEIEIIHLCLNVASGSQASQLCEGWYKNGGKCYDTILSTLLA